VGCSYVFHGLGVQYVILFNFVWCSTFCFLGKKRK
jgi:hypothetical protein